MGGTGATERENKSSKISILKLLLQEEYFSKISDLLNTPNNHKETALDCAWKNIPPPYKKQSDPPTNNGLFYDIGPNGIIYPHKINFDRMSVSNARIIEMLEKKGALLFKDLPENKQKPLPQQTEWDVCEPQFL